MDGDRIKTFDNFTANDSIYLLNELLYRAVGKSKTWGERGRKTCMNNILTDNEQGRQHT